MDSEKPIKIAINHDDYHAQHIGRTKDGNQFFLTTPFEPAIGGSEGCEYIALYTFDHDGKLLDYKINSLGSRGTYDIEEKEKQYYARLAELGEVEYCRIEVKPFSIEYKGVDFGLIAREPEEEDDEWAVELQPGNFMAFFKPWDSGDYDTQGTPNKYYVFQYAIK